MSSSQSAVMPPPPTPLETLTASTPGILDIQAGRRLLLAIVGAGLFSLLACSAFYLFEMERMTGQQLATLAHHAGQIIHAGDLGWQRSAVAGKHLSASNVSLSWQIEPGGQASRLATLPSPGENAETLHFPLDNAWLATMGRPELRLFLASGGGVIASSLGDAGAGEASALQIDAVGRIERQGNLFVQAPMRWDDQPDSPLLIVQQRLSLPFSLGEIALAGLFLWGILAGLIWLTVGIWLHKALQHIQYLAYHDPLTGLINRAALRIGLTHMLAESRRNNSPLAVLYLDLDRFKTINDSLGHAIGDQVLKEAAARLLGCIRDTDFVARLGGDEFLVVAGELNSVSDAAAIARKIIERLTEPMNILEQRLQTGCSIGIAIHPGSVSDPDSLIKQADSAMYAAKQEERGSYHFYDESLGIKASHRLSMEQKLRVAFDESQFEVHYQPIVCGRGGTQISGFEALLRWPQHGNPISPAEFIPLAEETGLIVPLGEWVLRQSCRQMNAWHARYPQGKTWSISVNVSVRQLHADDFADRVVSALSESGLPPGALVLELTESLYVDRHTAIPATLRRLRAMGVRLAMDDFGTGYSALASLSRLPLDRLKIDRSFVSNITHAPEELAIARTIIAIGQELGLEIVAEGVETTEQAALLNESGCQILQGWLFGKSLRADDLEKCLSDKYFPISSGG